MDAKTFWQKARVRSIRDLTPDIRLFELEPAQRFIPPAPGGHIDVTVQIDGRAAVRSYSLVGPCSDGVYRIAIKLLPDSRGGSAYMWSLPEGSTLTISEPGNHFELFRGRPDYVLIAGGIGITPIYSMALALSKAGARFRVLYATRSAADLAFADELAELPGANLQTYPAGEGRRLSIGDAITSLAPNGEMYVCGPIGMLEDARSAWAASGRPIERLRFETFGNSGRYPSVPFTVNLPLLGRSIEVSKNQTILEALEAAGIDAMYDCRRGECGLCALDVLEADGVIDHRDVFFSEDEKAQGHKLCACVSRMAGGSVSVDTGERM
ncbi:MAG: oxidoreductase [Hyphomicrobiales bacterium]|nr:oxidoreductase [Hyphomicrobiales bacterium]